MGFALPLLGLAAGVASTVGGAVMQNNAAKQAQRDAIAQADARNRQLAEYRQRMQAIQAESQANAQKAIDQYNPEQSKAREDQAQAGLENQYTKAVTEPAVGPDVPLGGSAPTVTDAAKVKAKENADAYTSMLAKRLAALGVQPQALLGSGTTLQRAGSLNDQWANFGKQETALLPQYQDFASTYWRLKAPPSTAGAQALSGLGNTFFKLAGSAFG